MIIQTECSWQIQCLTLKKQSLQKDLIKLGPKNQFKFTTSNQSLLENLPYRAIIIAHNVQFDRKYFNAIIKDQSILDKYQISWIDCQNLIEKVTIQRNGKEEKSHRLGDIFLNRFPERQKEWEEKAHQADFDVEMMMDILLDEFESWEAIEKKVDHIEKIKYQKKCGCKTGCFTKSCSCKKADKKCEGCGCQNCTNQLSSPPNLIENYFISKETLLTKE
eukprot:TRINITY_DN1310_c0_g1_i8.p2 TRINITY_DN1310_c0_g1~~TRINITY_DN1310_c0_g1_i8.p2  ORF type:complete len:219 (+),score=42.85 TRINITY_DN1310_c0_g1_i8:488-1144(+)